MRRLLYLFPILVHVWLLLFSIHASASESLDLWIDGQDYEVELQANNRLVSALGAHQFRDPLQCHLAQAKARQQRFKGDLVSYMGEGRSIEIKTQRVIRAISWRA